MEPRTTPHPAAGGRGSQAPFHRVVTASLIGTTIEWYGFFLYGAAETKGTDLAAVPKVGAR